MITRRTALKGLLAGGAITATSLSLSDFFVNTAQARSYSNSLNIPPLLLPRTENGIGIFDLSVQNGASRFLPGLDTPTLGINGNYLGPTLMLKKGKRTRFNVTNKLTERTTLHWHGLHLPAIADGGPHQVIEPGATWSPEFTIDNDAATYWYHSHMLHRTGEQVWKGLAGLMIIEDEQSKRLNLPRNYGVDDIPLVLQDRRFEDNGRLQYVSGMPDIMMGMRGDIMLVNGTIRPHFDATTSRIRLRILNGSNARFYNLGLDDNRPFQQVATDGGFLAAPLQQKRLILAPGERAEIIVNVKPDEEMALQGYPLPQTSGMMGMMGMMRRMMGARSFLDNGAKFDLLRIRPKGDLELSAPLPRKLVNLPVLQARTAVRKRRFVLQMGMGPGMMMGGRGRGGAFAINGKAMDKNRVDETVRLGDTEIWEIINMSPMPHPFHIHNAQFNILDRDGRPPQQSELGPKDTVVVGHREKVRVIVKFDDFADPELPYMYHCHILEHEDVGMMGQFVVR